MFSSVSTLADESLADKTLADESLADESLADKSVSDESLADEPRSDGSNRTSLWQRTSAVQRMFGKWGHQEKSSEIFKFS